MWHPDLSRPHDKYCICICPRRHWFFYINSEPPKYRKAREYAVEIDRFQAHFLNRTSYVDTTALVLGFADGRIAQALEEDRRHYGPLMPALCGTIQNMTQRHSVLTADELAAVLED